jgi:uncharacterized protein (DUF1800 family)
MTIHAGGTNAAKAALTGMLCVLVAVPQAAFAGPLAVSAPLQQPLTPQQRTLQALNRLTFGPRPGDVAAVDRMGLEAWFQQQLHPERIDDAALEARLAGFPAMQLNQAELMRRFPSPQMLRQMSKQGTPLPRDPVERAIYADSLAAYDAQQKKQAAAAGQDPAMAPETDMNAAGNAATGNAAGTLLSDGTVQNGAVSNAGAASMPDAAGKKKGKRAAEPMEGPMDPDTVAAVLALPPEQRIQRLVAMSPDEMLSFRAALRPRDRPALLAGLSPQQMETVEAMQQGPVRVVGAETLESRLLRDMESNRQLQAVMTDFWLNHFNVYVRKNQNEPYLLPAYQRDTILPNSLGRFEDLLVATAKSPAMLVYLDNWQSIGPNSIAATRVQRVQQARPNGQLAQALPKGINENYARELMELHTLGVGGGYTQQDVIEVAKCFTGWTIVRPGQVGQLGRPGQLGQPRRPYMGGMGAGAGETEGGFVFEPNRHEPGTKTVLGHTIREGGMNEGLEVLHILAMSPATAHFLSNKLAVRFVSDTPPPALVDRMAATYLKTGGDIAAVLTTMFHAPEFWSPEVYRAKVKTPLEFLTSAVRASGAQVGNPLALVQALDKLGMPLYGMQTPNGYSWLSDGWVSSNALISRMNFALVLSGDRIPGTTTDWPALLGEAADANAASVPTPATEKQLEALLLGQPAAEQTRQTVLTQFNNPGVQRTAQQNFNDGLDALLATNDPPPADGVGGMLKTKAPKNGGAGGLGFGAKANNQPATPLDTMAGLLLGSPEFQRR